MPQGSTRIGRPRRFAIDVAAVANLVGTLAKYLGLVVVFPIGVALWYSEPVWPFLVTGAATSAFGYALERGPPATGRGSAPARGSSSSRRCS